MYPTAEDSMPYSKIKDQVCKYGLEESHSRFIDFGMFTRKFSEFIQERELETLNF